VCVETWGNFSHIFNYSFADYSLAFSPSCWHPIATHRKRRPSAVRTGARGEEYAALRIGKAVTCLRCGGIAPERTSLSANMSHNRTSWPYRNDRILIRLILPECIALARDALSKHVGNTTIHSFDFQLAQFVA